MRYTNKQIIDTTRQAIPTAKEIAIEFFTRVILARGQGRVAKTVKQVDSGFDVPNKGIFYVFRHRFAPYDEIRIEERTYSVIIRTTRPFFCPVLEDYR